MVREFLLQAGSWNLLELLSGCSQSFRLWQRHTDQQCQYGTSGTLRRLSGHLLSAAGLFTSGGHFIVLRGVTANGKILVNDPNDSDAKNYINREFDMMSEIHATANAYWIFDKR